jgi:S1-C subfamily serine protease
MVRALAVLVVGGLALAGAGSTGAAPPRPEPAVALVESNGCQAVSEHAVGWLGPGGLVVTVAHAVRGSASLTVDGVPGRVVAIDVRADVAVLAPVAAVGGRPLGLAASSQRGGAAWVGHVVAGRVRSTATTASAGVVINIDEPADDTVYTRAGFSLTFGAVRGNSGAPVVDRSGAVIGMVFATARTDTHLSYAVSATEIATVLSGLTPTSPTVPTGRCP